MEHKLFLNNEVAEIVGITKRQVLDWSEKRLVVPFKESTGVGKKRLYDYVNLLEFGMCMTLFGIGMGFRSVRNIINDLRNSGTIRDWSEDFSEYYESRYEWQPKIDPPWQPKIDPPLG